MLRFQVFRTPVSSQRMWTVKYYNIWHIMWLKGRFVNVLPTLLCKSPMFRILYWTTPLIVRNWAKMKPMLPGEKSSEMCQIQRKYLKNSKLLITTCLYATLLHPSGPSYPKIIFDCSFTRTLWLAGTIQVSHPFYPCGLVFICSLRFKEDGDEEHPDALARVHCNKWAKGRSTLSP